MKWQQYIISDPEILAGKPTIKDTRLAVEFILDLLAKGWNEQQLLQNYPSLSTEALRALFAFVAECIHDETILQLPIRDELNVDSHFKTA